MSEITATAETRDRGGLSACLPRPFEGGLLVGATGVQCVPVSDKAPPRKTYIGIDNGVSGSLGVVGGGSFFGVTPTFECQDYTKTKKRIRRICWRELNNLLQALGCESEEKLVLLERPMVNPGRFVATASALRAYEATLIVLELRGLGYQTIDSKCWQKMFLPADCKGPELKQASMDVGVRMFPKFENRIRKHKDADGLFIAEYGRRMGL